MRPVMIVMVALAAASHCCRAADVAVVHSTLAARKDPAQARGYAMHTEAVTKKLSAAGVAFDMLGDEQVIAGRLADYKLAIFPYNQVSGADEIARIRQFVEDGGRLVWFYGFPRELGPLLGIEKWTYRGKSRDGEFFTMKFAADRPAGFPAEVHQESPNCRIVEQTADDARALARWHDKEGRDTGIPAVILSPRSVYVAHVLWSDANADQQMQLLVAAVGHFMPGKWTELVEGALAKAAAEAGYEDLGRLAQAAAKSAVAAPLARQATAQAEQARERLASKQYGEALALAGQVRANAQSAAAALFPSRPYELRGAWVHPTDATDWEALMARLAAAHFNAVFPLMCGPGSARFPSAFAPQVTQRDHMRECIDAARRHGIEVHVWKANWQVLSGAKDEAAKFAAQGRFVLSAEQAAGKPEKSSYQWSTRWLDPSDERNRRLELDMMTELVAKYRPDGVHFDFMRYPESGYCFCPRCRKKFEDWAGVQPERWPEDCLGKGPHAERFRQWRRELQTSLVKQIAEAVRRIDPRVKLSLAARASMTGSYDSDAQDWVTWSKQGYLDFLCPMDYTDRVEVLRAKLEPQVAAIQGAVPVYAGLGVSPSRSATPANLCQQIELARRLGADGFLLFALSPFSEAMLPALRLGPTAAPVTLMPHHRQPLKATFEYPAPGRPAALTIRLVATAPGVQKITAAAFQQPAAGGAEQPIAAQTRGAGPDVSLTVPLPETAENCTIVVHAQAFTGDGKQTPCYFRSLPIRPSTE